jgi:hypothetical protein
MRETPVDECYLIEVQEPNGPEDFEWVDHETYKSWEMALVKFAEFEGKSPARLSKWTDRGWEKLYETE